MLLNGKHVKMFFSLTSQMGQNISFKWCWVQGCILQLMIMASSQGIKLNVRDSDKLRYNGTIQTSRDNEWQKASKYAKYQNNYLPLFCDMKLFFFSEKNRFFMLLCTRALSYFIICIEIDRTALKI